MDINIKSNHWLCQLVLPEMIERRDGAIIIVSSVGGLRGSADLGAYAISKAADLQLVRNLAVEHGPHNVRVNAISPGLIRTDFARALWENPDILKRATAADPLRRIGEPEELAGYCRVSGVEGRYLYHRAEFRRGWWLHHRPLKRHRKRIGNLNRLREREHGGIGEILVGAGDTDR